MKTTKHILVAPLDWGLGHTTHCVPVIRHLQNCGHKVLFAGNEDQRAYITATLTDINTIHLEGYNVRYASSGFMFMLAIARQVPKLLAAIKSEHEWLNATIKEYEIDAVISDNRYGLYHNDIPCIIMTHQLQVISGWGIVVDNMVRKLHYKYLEKFDKCWIVDAPEGDGLAGKLSHPEILPEHISYIGLLSQIREAEPVNKGYLLVLLSGPEPQRTIFADKIWEQIQQYEGEVVFVEGSLSIKAKTDIPKHITYHQQLVKDQLEEALSSADMVICRSGYSTLMDLVRLNKKAILIPTPGQTEQEYLAKYLQDQGIFISTTQADFDLKQCMDTASKFEFHRNSLGNFFRAHKQIIDNWVAQL